MQLKPSSKLFDIHTEPTKKKKNQSVHSAFAGITPAVKVDVALLVTARGLRSMGGRGKVIFTDANRLHAYIQHSSRQLSVQGKLLSCTAG